jgi:hypothetical protein
LNGAGVAALKAALREAVGNEFQVGEGLVGETAPALLAALRGWAAGAALAAVCGPPGRAGAIVCCWLRAQGLRAGAALLPRVSTRTCASRHRRGPCAPFNTHGLYS